MLRGYKRPFEERHKILSIILKILIPLVVILMIAGIIILPRTPLYTRHVANTYSEKIFPKVAYMGNWFSDVFMFSITEMGVVIGSILVLCLIVMFFVYLVKSIKRKRFLKYIYKVFCFCLAIAFYATYSFMLMHGLNYKRDTADRRLGLKTHERKIEEIYQVQAWAYTGMIMARQQLGEDCNGVSHMKSSFPEAVFHANELVSSVEKRFDLGLSETFVRAKPVMLSKYWSYTHIVGVYDPFIGESNINVDYTATYDFPLTICHELVHARGYAKEGDANFIAAIACTMSDRPDFRYAGYFEIFMSICGLLDNFDAFNGADMQMVIRDIRAGNAYWDAKEVGKVAETIHEVSEKSNDSYLKANGEEEGTETYVVDSNIYVEFFYDYVLPEISK